MSVMPTEKKRRWVSHKDTYRRVLQHNEVVVVDALEDGDDSNWKVGNALLAKAKRMSPGLMIACDEFKAAIGISELPLATSSPPEVRWESSDLSDTGSSGSAVFTLNHDWIQTDKALNLHSSTV